MDETIKMKFCPQAVTRMSANQKNKNVIKKRNERNESPVTTASFDTSVEFKSNVSYQTEQFLNEVLL